MVSLTISSGSGILAALLTSLLREVCPEASVSHEPAEPAEQADLISARVVARETGRWFYVSTQHGVDDESLQALADGACALVSLESRPEDFQMAVGAVLGKSESHVPMQIIRMLAERRAGEVELQGVQPVRLTDRELDVLRLVALGYSNSEIAKMLTISVNTVRSHLHALAVKLDADNRVRVLANARALGLVDTPGTNRGKRTA